MVMKKTFKFTLDTETELDVIQAIERVPKSLRSQFLVDVVRLVSSNLVNYALTQNDNFNLPEKENINKETQETKKDNQEVNSKEKKKLNISRLLGGF